jgi:hypothetical protein
VEQFLTTLQMLSIDWQMTHHVASIYETQKLKRIATEEVLGIHVILAGRILLSNATRQTAGFVCAPAIIFGCAATLTARSVATVILVLGRLGWTTVPVVGGQG